MEASYKKHTLKFKLPSGTSRGVLKTKETWVISITHNGKEGIGECGMFKGLSVDDRPDFINKLNWACLNINKGLAYLLQELIEFPSIQFGLETAFMSMEATHPFELYPSLFTKQNASIAINGLIWMGNESFMKQQIQDKIESGFSCLKIKIGAIDFLTELDILKSIRQEFTSKDIELRVDANGAFNPNEALEKLNRLSELDLHSIEQPIQQGQIENMASLCEVTPLPIALDEELIGVLSLPKKIALLKAIKPQYIILKPTLIGGFSGSKSWQNIAETQNIGWWITSALESNIGLNAIAQYTFMQKNPLPQGLGTGSLFINNFQSPLYVHEGRLHYGQQNNWKINL